MRILVVSATALEVAPLLKRVAHTLEPNDRLARARYRGHDIDVLTTGVGMVATAAWCARTLTQTSYTMAFNVGLCGTFDRSIRLGSVVHVTSDCLPELGAEDGDAFLTIHDMHLLGADEFPFRSGQLINQLPPPNAALDALPRARGITVNTVHGHEQSIAAAAARFDPQVETMEGAAFMFASLIHAVPFAQIRAVSNIVERRNRDAWDIPGALASLTAATFAILDQT
jgi:futalosine hydrolase